MISSTLVAQSSAPAWSVLMMLSMVAVVAFGFVVLLLVLLATRYKKCPSNQILVIHGKAGGDAPARCLHGGAAFVVPLLQRYDYMSLAPIRLEIPLAHVPTLDRTPVSVRAAYTVAIGTTAELMQRAAARLMGLGAEQIAPVARDPIVRHLRRAIEATSIADLDRDRDAVARVVSESVAGDLNRIGLVLIHGSITEVAGDTVGAESIGTASTTDSTSPPQAGASAV